MIRQSSIVCSAVFLLGMVLPSQTPAGRITPDKTELGYLCTAGGSFSTAMGNLTVASGNYSTAMGHATTASGHISLAMGSRTTAYSAYETVIGIYNTEYSPDSTTGWNNADRLFVIGNGTGSFDRSDAMVVLKNGNVGIGTARPGEELEIHGHYPYVKFTGHAASDARQIGVNDAGLAIYNPVDSRYDMIIDNIGNVGIGGITTVYYKLQVFGDAAGTSWTNLSSRDFKEDIRKVHETAHPIMLSKLMDMDPSTYKYKEAYGGDGTTRLGFIAEDMPGEVLSKDGKGVDVYALLTLTIGAMKAQQKKIGELEARINELQRRVKGSNL